MPSAVGRDELIELTQGHRCGHRIAGSNLTLKIKIIPDENRKVARVSAFIDADKRTILASALQNATPAFNRRQSNRLYAMGKKASCKFRQKESVVSRYLSNASAEGSLLKTIQNGTEPVRTVQNGSITINDSTSKRTSVMLRRRFHQR
jgi:hypothetical protein